MPEQRSPDFSAAHKADHLDFIVLETIIDPCAGLWSAAEVQQALGGDIDVEDSITRLHGIGLIHKLGEFIFPTRAAARSHDLPR
jgi:hypothetical protein